jgi:hypothetical protein
MNYRYLGLVALMASPIAALAQVTNLQYSEGIFSGNVTLSAPLPEDGTFSVSPTTFDFPGVGFGASYNYLCPGCGYGLGGMGEYGSASFSFTTDNGRISGWGINIDFTGTPGTNTETSLYALITPGSDSFTQQTFGFACQPPPGLPSPCQPISFSSSNLGVWTTAAPEIDPASAASGLTLLLGGLAALSGRRKLVLTANEIVL